MGDEEQSGIMPVRKQGKVLMFLMGATLAGMMGSGAAQNAVRKPELNSKQSVATVRGVDYNRDVRPILSQHCFKCHGPDEGQRQAKLRLDQRTGALALLSSSRRAVVPGKPEESTLVTRVFSHGADIMPPAYANKPLSDKEKDTLKQWIANGAAYSPHWAFVPPHAVSLPRVKNTAWPRNPIDYFVLARLEQQGLKPSPPADRYTLVRRVYLDLIGLPPTPAEADAFLKDTLSERLRKTGRPIACQSALWRKVGAEVAGSWPATPIQTATRKIVRAPYGRTGIGLSTP